ncbi:MAG: tetratricopeptide repeat protein [Janthinobacterium lividum]
MRPVAFVSLRAALLLGFAAIVAMPGQASAQMDSREGISLQNQILELRHEVEALGGSGGNGGGGPPIAPPMGSGGQSRGNNGNGDGAGLTPQLLDRVQTLEDEVRTMRGELDQLTNQVQQQNAAVTKQLGDMNFALQQGHGGAPAPGGSAPDGGTGPDMPTAGPAPVAAPPVQVKRTPESSLAAGNAALAHRDYAGAQTAARDVLAGPRSPRQVDAQYLLAQSLAGQKQYQQAAVAYYDAYNRAPRSARAPDALLGVSASLIALGDKPSACQALTKVRAEFPSPVPRVSAATKALRSRAGCR